MGRICVSYSFIERFVGVFCDEKLYLDLLFAGVMNFITKTFLQRGRLFQNNGKIMIKLRRPGMR